MTPKERVQQFKDLIHLPYLRNTIKGLTEIVNQKDDLLLGHSFKSDYHDVNIGLCNNTCLNLLNQDYVDSISKQWNKFSGISEFPVPSDSSDETPISAYYSISNLYAGDYGKLRLEFAEFIVDELCKDYNLLQGKQENASVSF